MLFNAGLGIYCEQNRPDTFVLYQYQFQCLPVSVNNHLITRHVAQLTWTAGGPLAAARTHQGEKLNRLSRDQWGLRGFCQSCQSFSRKLVIDKTNISYWGWIFKYPSVRWSVSSLVCRAAQPGERVQAVCWTDRRHCQCAARWQDSRVLLALAARANNDDEQRTCQWLWLSRQGKWLWGLRGLGWRKYWCW